MTSHRRSVRSPQAVQEPGRVRRGWRWVREIAHQIHAGEDEMRAVYGDNPNGRPDAERIAAAAALSNLGNVGGAGSGGGF
jgi:hypothetical protein